ncbi:MAG: hypothetical protein HQM13_14785 [SAR324 cluster bacterium]|nr:hypothetical protein [SAR324 cluster bacterium]
MDKILNSLRQLQTNVQGQRKLPFPVQEAQKEVQQTNLFVKSLLKKENQLILPHDVQTNVLQGLAEVNRMFSQLIENCRSEHHFQLYREQFLQIMHTIRNLSFCINLSIENGFYDYEPRGFRLQQSVVLSWKKIREIHQAFTQQVAPVYVPYTLTHNQQLKPIVHKMYEKIAPLAASILKFKNLETLSHQHSQEELKIINRYFKQASDFHRLIDRLHIDRKATNNILKSLNIEGIDQILKELHHLENKIQRYRSNTDSLILKDALHFSETTTNDLHARMSTIHIQLEASRVLLERQHHLQTSLNNHSALSAVQEFAKVIQFEKKQLDFFSNNFSRINQSLLAVSSVLANLSISFGKIYQLSLKSELTPQFLPRAIETAHNLLSKSIKFAEARKADSQQLQLALKKATLFQKAVEDVIFSAFKELEEAKKAITKYDHKLLAKMEQTSKEEKLSPSMIQQFLKEAYEDRAELSTAAIYLHNISYNFELLVKELKTVDSAYQQIDFSASTEEEAKLNAEQILKILKSKGQSSPKKLQDLWMSVQYLHWYIEDILLVGLKEERRFEEEFNAYIAPVKKRIEERNIQEKLKEQKAVETKQVSQGKIKETSEEDMKPEESLEHQDIVVPQKKSLPSDLPIPEKKVQKKASSVFDPFLPQTMDDLKKACKTIGSERLLSILEVIERPHAFFNFLERLELEYDPESPFTELLWMAELSESQSAMDFFLSFVKVKFLPHGYFDANGVQIPYNKETKKIEKLLGVELYLKISTKYLETPKVIFKRLLQMMLGYEETTVLNPEENMEIVNLMKMDHIVTDDDKEKLHALVPFLA